MCLLGSAGGWKAQEALWKITEWDGLQIIDVDEHMRKQRFDIVP